ncbi:gonadotropin subunit beta-1-like [Sardina pilchardus]|uniref:gonadotropin subunit beta-1-like n=1 Tax=Sardina pilchardus TaxID=27697 RepID=UPI002E0D5E26
MHLVTMVALWSLVGAVAPECHRKCHPVNVTITVTAKNGQSCLVETQGCAGLCYNKASLYSLGQTQESCHFHESTYESVQCGSEQLPVLKALSCKCSLCSTDDYDCSPISSRPPCPASAYLPPQYQY